MDINSEDSSILDLWVHVLKAKDEIVKARANLKVGGELRKTDVTLLYDASLNFHTAAESLVKKAQAVGIDEALRSGFDEAQAEYIFGILPYALEESIEFQGEMRRIFPYLVAPQA